MAAHRAQWKGFIKFGEVSCGVSLYIAASTSERIAFNTINASTGNRVKREFVDSETYVLVIGRKRSKTSRRLFLNARKAIVS